MPIFRGQTLYFRPSTVDVAFTNVRTNVRALQSTAGADTNFTATFTSTTQATQTVDPFTNIIDVTDDKRTKLGWAMNQNEASVDSMGSIPTRTRYTPAGIWQFRFAWTSNYPGRPSARYPVTISYHVYKVAANGGARTLLFSVSAPTATVYLSTGSGTGEVTSSQPEYSFAPDETLLIAVQVTSAASDSFSGTTDTVITFRGATSGSFFVKIPPVGLRSVYHDSSSLVGAGVASRSSLIRKAVSSLADGLGSFLRKLSASRSYSLTGSGLGSFLRKLSASRSHSSTGSGLGVRFATVKKSVPANGVGVATRLLLLRKAFSVVGAASAIQQKLIVKGLYQATGSSTSSFDRSGIFSRSFDASGNAIGSFERTAIFFRTFNANGTVTIRPRIALDWDDLPDPGGGTINVYRPLIIFDD